MILTNKQFNGGNYINWSNAARMGLGAKLKLGFVDHTIPKPNENSPDLQNWLTYDYMVRCWLLNSLTPETSECFMYAKSAKELWDELVERFGEANGPLIYQLHRDLTLLMQDNGPMSVYFFKVKKIWDELQNLDGLPRCACGIKSQCTCNLGKKL